MFFKGLSNLAAINVETVRALAIFLQNQWNCNILKSPP